MDTPFDVLIKWFFFSRLKRLTITRNIWAYIKGLVF
jgi:hypothetical protein